MSFSSDIKQELNKNNQLANKEVVKSELKGYFITRNTNIINQKEIKYATESDYNINRFSKLLANLDINHHIEIAGKLFVIRLAVKDVDFISIKNGQTFLVGIEERQEEHRKAIIRGAFMGSGSVNNPQKEYHLEIDLNNQENLERFVKILEQWGILVKTFQTSLYICQKDFLCDKENISQSSLFLFHSYNNHKSALYFYTPSNFL